MQTAPATSRKTPEVINDDFLSASRLPSKAGNGGETAESAITS